jgi:hypothetical protein
MARSNSRRMHTLRAEFTAECKADDLPCWICTLGIDYEAPFDDYKNDERFQLDHYLSVSTHPELQEEWSNFRPSHAGCNRDRGNGAPKVDLGVLSREWV